MNVLVAGGAGYIGSHTCLELINEQINPIIVDNFSNSSPEVVKRLELLTGKKLCFYDIDLTNYKEIANIFNENKIDAVIHFAGLKSISESNSEPLKYYGNNLISTINLCNAMNEFNVKKLIFSSSATVYGLDNISPLKESSSLSALNPYGRTKLFNESILTDLYDSDQNWSIIILRYFNPIGAHFSGCIGESPNGIPNNLIPYLNMVALKKFKVLNVYGNDYNTKDGTGVRDYIHVMDVAKGHIKALFKVLHDNSINTYNLGTGKGYSVFEIIKTFEDVNGIKIPFVLRERRKGDIDICISDPTKAMIELGWNSSLGLEDMLKDSWNWASRNPKGY